ncbi:MAG: hypothetical protein HQM08_26330 [Candidatus Riflebacteria bacterium]|nr:hypothetical protein [Candidatus Riflebacteria bacterium]
MFPLNRRGLSLYLVIFTLVIVSILAFSSHFVALESLQKFRRSAESSRSYLLARSAIACVIGRIQEGLHDPNSEISKTLLSENLKAGTFLNLDLSPLEKLVNETREAKTLKATAMIASIAQLDPLNLGLQTGGLDSAERQCDLQIEASSKVGPAETFLKEIRELRIVHLMPGILGKFSLFVKNTGNDPYAYNKYANTINGWPDDRVLPTNQTLPIILKNGGELDEGTLEIEDPESFKKRGYVYFGGGPISLNLTCGNDEMYGEFFHFTGISDTPTIPGYFEQSPPPYFTHPPDFSLRHPQKVNTDKVFAPDFAYCLKYVVQGFFTTDSNGQNMNFDDRMAVDFPGPSTNLNEKMESSIFHLYGTKSACCPTLVLGDVRRRYAEYAGVLIEATGNTKRDAILTYVRQTTKTMDQLPPFPPSVPAATGGDLSPEISVFTDPGTTYKELFGNDDTYKAFMCHLVEEPYLRSHDFLYYKGKDFFEPRKSFFGDNGTAKIQTTFTLPFHQNLNRSKPFFQEGNLDSLPTDFLLAKATYRVPDGKSFFSRFQDKGKLKMDCIVSIIGSADEPVEFPPDTIIEKAGIVIVENGNIRISGMAPGPEPDQIQVFVALRGNIELDLLRTSELKAILIALNGTIVNRQPNLGLGLIGSLAVGTFQPNTFPAGGKIVYDSISDPSGQSWGIFYRAFVSDFSMKVTRN